LGTAFGVVFGAAVRATAAAGFFVAASAGFAGFLAATLGAAIVFALVAGLDAMSSDSPFVCWISRPNHASRREAST
jgi:hypothetical protein